MARRAGRYRFQLLFQTPNRGQLHSLLDSLLPEVPNIPEARRVKWSIDVDPADLF